MQFSIIAVFALQAAGIIAAPVNTEYNDLAKDSIIIKSATNYKRADNEKRDEEVLCPFSMSSTLYRLTC
jgi:acyl-CoA synthetase (AMP-forming)/AMP-acid ligase II